LLECKTATFPHILHFDGHGFFGKRCNQAGCKKAYKQGTIQCECGAPLGKPQGYLVFERSDRTADYVSAQELGELLGNLQRQEQPNFDRGIVLVVLSSCRSGMSRLSESVFNGVAQNLIGQGIPAVVAMSYSISVLAASAFAEAFYHSLGQKESLAIAFRRGQSAIGIEGNQWYRPVLYLRWEDNQGGQLFKFPLNQPHSMPNPEEGVFPNNQQVSPTMNKSASQQLDLQQELADFLEEREACKNQYRSTIDDAQKLVLKRKLEKLDRQIASIESQL
jgi:hypothetical protein